MTLDGQPTKIKVVDLKMLWNFIVDNFLIWHILSSKTTFEFPKFEIQILYTTLDGETTEMKFVDLEKLWNFVVDNVFIWLCLGTQTINLNSG
jgi:hypothetical protein